MVYVHVAVTVSGVVVVVVAVLCAGVEHVAGAVAGVVVGADAVGVVPAVGSAAWFIGAVVMACVKGVHMKSKTPVSNKPSSLPFKVGDAVLIRTVTMTQLGRVKDIADDFLVLEDGGWVACTARFSVTLATGALEEFEPAPSWIYVSRGAIVDAYPWAHDLPRTAK